MTHGTLESQSNDGSFSNFWPSFSSKLDAITKIFLNVKPHGFQYLNMVELSQKIRTKVDVENGCFCILGVALTTELTYLCVTRGLLRQDEARNGFQYLNMVEYSHKIRTKVDLENEIFTGSIPWRGYGKNYGTSSRAHIIAQSTSYQKQHYVEEK